MSLRILNPVMVTRNISCKRDLFGAANSNNSEETTRLFHEELERSQQLANMKWGFDFRSGVPLPGHTQFIWERVTCREFNFAPQQYTLTRAAHVRQTLPVEEDTEMELMLDERSERENIRMSSQSTMNTTDSDSCDDESQDEEATTTSVFKLPQVVGSSTTSHCTHTNTASSRNRRNSAIEKLTVTLRKRQPKITEYMKERKRLIQTPKKKTPTKRMRTSSGSSSTSASSNSSSSSCRTRLGL